MGAGIRELKLQETTGLVRDLRNNGVSLDEIAVACGASWWTVLRWMRGERAPHPHHFRRLTELHETRATG
jgi:hypothetical protein